MALKDSWSLCCPLPNNPSSSHITSEFPSPHPSLLFTYYLYTVTTETEHAPWPKQFLSQPGGTVIIYFYYYYFILFFWCLASLECFALHIPLFPLIMTLKLCIQAFYEKVHVINFIMINSFKMYLSNSTNISSYRLEWLPQCNAQDKCTARHTAMSWYA